MLTALQRPLDAGLDPVMRIELDLHRHHSNHHVCMPVHFSGDTYNERYVERAGRGRHLHLADER
jgi:hypothetical protein